MPNLAILLAPAEQKQPGGNPFAPDMFDYRTSGTFNYFEDLNPDRRELIDGLHDILEDHDEDDLADMFGLEGPELDEAIRVDGEIYDAPLMSALDRYSPGVMYKAMDFPGLPTGAQRRLLENGIIFSGLYGLLRPDDLIANYRLKMDATLPEIGKVGKHWRPIISPHLNKHLASRFVWNLLPGVHESAWEDERTYAHIVKVRFLDASSGERKPVTHNVKVLRGQLVNYIVRESAEDLEALREWPAPEGYRFDGEATVTDDEARSTQAVFVKG